jgi:hypothetical protein
MTLLLALPMELLTHVPATYGKAVGIVRKFEGGHDDIRVDEDVSDFVA